MAAIPVPKAVETMLAPVAPLKLSQELDQRGYERRMPHQLQKRLERSFLLEGRSPRLPPIEPLLYTAPKRLDI